MKTSLSDIVHFLNEGLQIEKTIDSPQAYNGLQLENSGSVHHVALAVDGSFLALKKAAEVGADLLIVHHGLFWQSMLPLTGLAYQKVKAALEADLAVYSAHLPLDNHPVWGNNACLARECGLRPVGGGFDYHGVELGIMCEWEGSLSALKQRVEEVIGSPWTCFGRLEKGEAPVYRVFVCSGGAGDDLVAVKALGADIYLTGEGAHWNIPLAEELGLVIGYGGHYFTETLGVQSLGKALKERFGLAVSFLDLPPEAYRFSEG